LRACARCPPCTRRASRAGRSTFARGTARTLGIDCARSTVYYRHRAATAATSGETCACQRRENH
jgi:cytidylate kinase